MFTYPCQKDPRLQSHTVSWMTQLCWTWSYPSIQVSVSYPHPSSRHLYLSIWISLYPLATSLNYHFDRCLRQTTQATTNPFSVYLTAITKEFSCYWRGDHANLKVFSILSLRLWFWAGFPLYFQRTWCHFFRDRYPVSHLQELWGYFHY